jgi:hypothetical protein
LEGEYEIAMTSFQVFNTLYNITSVNNLFYYSTNGGVGWKTLTFNPGAYEINDINTEVQRQMVINGDYTVGGTGNTFSITIAPNLNLGKTQITLSNNYQVDFTKPNNFSTLLGFTSRVLSAGYNLSDNISQIRNYNSIYINTNLTNGILVNNRFRNVIYSTSAYLVPPGYNILLIPNPPRYYPLIVDRIADYRVFITDENGNQLNFNGETIEVQFHLRQTYQ